jgi:hypothetical protein
MPPSASAICHDTFHQPGNISARSSEAAVASPMVRTTCEQAKPEDMLPHGTQLGQAELQADHEHQEDDAEFGQVADAGSEFCASASAFGPMRTPATR